MADSSPTRSESPLAARQADLAHALRGERAREAKDLLEGEPL
jgi:hypothetical protein